MIKETHHVKRTSEEVFEFIASNLSWSALFGSKTAECQSMVPWFLSAAPTHPSRMVLLGTLTVTQPIKKISHISKTPNVQYHVHSYPLIIPILGQIASAFTVSPNFGKKTCDWEYWQSFSIHNLCSLFKHSVRWVWSWDIGEKCSEKEIYKTNWIVKPHA